MKIFAVGGQVRDKILGHPIKDQDFVVVGSTTQQMLDLGYEMVGSSFPVFLKDGHEYALARTERKTGVGYNGFEVTSTSGSLDPTLLAKFQEKGYDPNVEYELNELMAVFQDIS